MDCPFEKRKYSYLAGSLFKQLNKFPNFSAIEYYFILNSCYLDSKKKYVWKWERESL